MKISTEQRQVTTSGMTEENDTRAFTIKADAAMFKMLSSTLYTHKIRAVIRELTCNAWDAHQAAKRFDTSIEVHLPTQMECFFQVRDFGKGLSHENVMKLFSTYGESTKQNSNKEIGGFGIGSKSPFCYVDSFLVESRFNGVKSSYNAYIEKSGFPSIVRMGESLMEDGELSGITIKMNASVKDIPEFHSEGKRVLAVFERPAVKANVPFTEYEVSYKNEYGVILGTQYGSVPYGLYAKMGNVVYPIPSEKLQVLYGSGKLINSFFYSSKLYLFNFKIGELEVAPSREQLSLNEDTVEIIQKRLISFIEQFKKERDAKLSLHKYPWQFINDIGNYDTVICAPTPKFRETEIKVKKRRKQLCLPYNQKITVDEISTRLTRFNNRQYPVILSDYLYKNQKDLDKSPRQFSLKSDKDINEKINGRSARKVKFPRYKDRIYFEHNYYNRTVVYGFGVNRKDLAILPKIVLMYGAKETLASTALKYKYFCKSQGLKNTVVYTVKLPFNDPQYLRILKRELLHIPESCYVWFKDLPEPTEQQLVTVGLSKIEQPPVAKVPVTKVVTKFNVLEVRLKINEPYTGTVDILESPVQLAQYDKLQPGEVIYYMNFSEWKNEFWLHKDVAGLYAKSLILQKWNNDPNKPRIYGFCKSHIKMIEDDPKFVPANELLKEYCLQAIKEDTYYTYDFLKSVMYDYSKSAYFGVDTQRGFEDIKNYTIRHKEMLKYSTIIDRMKDLWNSSRGRHPKGREELGKYAKVLGWDIPQNLVDNDEKNSQNDSKFLKEFLEKYPMFKLSGEPEKETCELFEQYAETTDKFNKIKRK